MECIYIYRVYVSDTVSIAYGDSDVQHCKLDAVCASIVFVEHASVTTATSSTAISSYCYWCVVVTMRSWHYLLFISFMSQHKLTVVHVLARVLTHTLTTHTVCVLALLCILLLLYCRHAAQRHGGWLHQCTRH
jgi:hypothetical protein